MKRARTCITLDGELWKSLKREAEETNQSLSRHIENLLLARWNRSMEIKRDLEAVKDLGVV